VCGRPTPFTFSLFEDTIQDRGGLLVLGRLSGAVDCTRRCIFVVGRRGAAGQSRRSGAVASGRAVGLLQTTCVLDFDGQ
jgi:hypothetical protein